MGAFVDDFKTVEECDRALDNLTVKIAQAERRLATAPRRSPNQPAGWRAEIEEQLRINKLTLPRLQQRRADLKREERQQRHQDSLCGMGGTSAQRARAKFMDLAWTTEPDAMLRVEALMKERHPELFKDTPCRAAGVEQ